MAATRPDTSAKRAGADMRSSDGLGVWRAINASTGCRRAQGGPFIRRARCHCERMDTVGEFARQQRVDHAVALDAALADERGCDNFDTEMGFAALTPAAMASVLVAFVMHSEEFGQKRRFQRVCYAILDTHGGGLAHCASLRKTPVVLARPELQT
jgi:hypothetical protein